MKRRMPRPSELAPLLQFRRPQLSPTKRRLESALTIDDLRRIAKRRTPKAAFDYTDGAAEEELSLARARQAFRDIEFHPTILRDVAKVDTSRNVLGDNVALPFGIAPTGFTRLMQTEGEIAGDYLEELLDLLDFDGDIDLDVEGDRAIVSIDGGGDLNKLVGRKGEVLDALQELTRLAVHQKTGERSRLMLDIARWRRRRRDELAALGDKVARRVLETGEREQLAPMTPFERKIVHDAVAVIDGVRSESEGVEPSRRVVVLLN